MGNIGIEEAMQGNVAKLTESIIEAPIKILEIWIEIQKNSAEKDMNKAAAKTQKYKLNELKKDNVTGKVSMEDLNRKGEDIADLSGLDKECFKILDKNLKDAGIKYHVDSFKGEDGNRVFSVLFQEKDAGAVQRAVEKSLRQMNNPNYRKKTKDRPSVLDSLEKAKGRANEINNEHKNKEKHKHQEQAR